ncbi:unnamed protein product [Boreogadus saida]
MLLLLCLTPLCCSRQEVTSSVLPAFSEDGTGAECAAESKSDDSDQTGTLPLLLYRGLGSELQGSELRTYTFLGRDPCSLIVWGGCKWAGPGGRGSGSLVLVILVLVVLVLVILVLVMLAVQASVQVDMSCSAMRSSASEDTTGSYYGPAVPHVCRIT